MKDGPALSKGEISDLGEAVRLRFGSPARKALNRALRRYDALTDGVPDELLNVVEVQLLHQTT